MPTGIARRKMGKALKQFDSEHIFMQEVVDCLKDVLENIMIDFPDDDPRKLRYIKALKEVEE